VASRCNFIPNVCRDSAFVKPKSRSFKYGSSYSKGEGEAKRLSQVADAGQPVLSPAVGATARMIVRKVVPDIRSPSNLRELSPCRSLRCTHSDRPRMGRVCLLVQGSQAARSYSRLRPADTVCPSSSNLYQVYVDELCTEVRFRQIGRTEVVMLIVRRP
jgi:hypothetical protein